MYRFFEIRNQGRPFHQLFFHSLDSGIFISSQKASQNRKRARVAESPNTPDSVSEEINENFAQNTSNLPKIQRKDNEEYEMFMPNNESDSAESKNFLTKL